MSDESFVHKIRVSIGQAFHHKHHNPDGKVDIESIASEHGVSEDQVREQMEYLRGQNMIRGPLSNEGLQVRGVPQYMMDDHHMTEDGLNWAMAGYPVI
jgi:hypothetical protein